MTIDTQRLTIRGFASYDWRDLQQMIIQKEASEYAVYDHQWPVSDEEIKRIVGWFVDNPNYFAVCTKEPKLIGYILLNNTEHKNEFDMGYCFNEDYMGKGFATEACTALLTYAFDKLKVKKVICNTAQKNEPSCRLLARLGMTRVADLPDSTLRNDEKGNPITFLGVQYTMSNTEWSELTKAQLSDR